LNDNNESLPEEATPAPPTHSIFIGPDGLRAGWSLLIYIAILAAFVFAARFIAGMVHHHAPAPAHKSSAPVEQPPLAALLGEGIPFLIIAGASWIMSRIERRPVGVYGLGGQRRTPHFFSGLVAGVLFLSVLVFALTSSGLLVFDSRLLFGMNILRYGVIWLVGFLLVALLEDYLFRGYLQFTLARGLTGLFETSLSAPLSQALGFWTAAFLISRLCSLVHGSNPGESPLGLVSVVVAGLVFCLSLWRTGSLWWAIGFHASWDWAQSFLYGVADSGTMVKFHLFATHPVGKPLLSGGATGPEGSLLMLPVMAVIVVVIVFMLPKRIHHTLSRLAKGGAPGDL